MSSAQGNRTNPAQDRGSDWATARRLLPYLWPRGAPQLRARMALALMTLSGANLLVLDEPTNHLDVDAKNWLMGFLRNYRGALLVISHDLDLLDEAITRVVHLDRPNEDSLGQVFEYKGTYSQYRTAREKDEVRLAKVAAQQAKEIARLQSVVDRFGAKATKAAMAHSKEKQIARLESQRVETGPGDRQLRMRFPDPPPCGATVIRAEHMSKAYGGPAVFEDVSFDLGRGERLLVLGLNGAGKTSLLRILAGETTANLGDFEFGHQDRLFLDAADGGYFATPASAGDVVARFQDDYAEIEQGRLQPVIIHFAGKRKPWLMPSAADRHVARYWQYRSLSPWHGRNPG